MIKDSLSTKFFRCEHIEHCNSKMQVARSSWKHYHHIIDVACKLVNIVHEGVFEVIMT